MNPLQEIFAGLSGGGEKPKPNPATTVSPDAVARAIEAQNAQRLQSPSPAGSYSGAAFQDLMLNLADAKFDKGAVNQFPIQGHGLYLARDGSSPDAVVWVNAGHGEIRLSPGAGFRGKFDGFTIRLFGKRRNITRHDARLVVQMDPSAHFTEFPGSLARFHPVPLLGGDRLLNEVGEPFASPSGSSTAFYPQGFTKLLIELKADSGLFGASEVFSFSITTLPVFVSGISSAVATLDAYGKTVTTANGSTELAFIWEPPPLAHDPNEPSNLSGSGSSSSRQAISIGWTKSGTVTTARGWISGVQ